MSQPDPYRSALQTRIRLRIEYLALLHILPTEPSWNVESITRPTEPTRAPSTPVFDSVLPYLRQTMPPSDVTIPNHADSWTHMLDAMERLYCVRDINSDLLTWEISTRARAWRRKDLNIVRSLYKVGHMVPLTLPDERDMRLTDFFQSFFNERIKDLIGRYVALISDLPENFLTILDGAIATPDRRQFAIWRDIVGGVRQLYRLS